MTVPRIALTPGEPAGIGPDLAIIAAQQSLQCELVAIADPQVLTDRAKLLDLPLKLKPFSADEPSHKQQPGELQVMAVELNNTVDPGKLNHNNSRYVLKTIARATRGCLEGQFDAMVTAPVHKGIINEAGIAFSGHTEYIADLCQCRPAMMLSTPGLKVALATTHLPLSEVSSAITHTRLRNILRILQSDLIQHFGIANPVIAVCGLNPHAGENGHLGKEEIDIIEPVLDNLRKQDMQIIGPLPADTIFTPKYLDQCDAVLAMYHDQGLPVLKHKGFGNAVNITLGLPIIRTSVDHGTALDLAGTGNIDSGSLFFALETAMSMSRHKHQYDYA